MLWVEINYHHRAHTSFPQQNMKLSTPSPSTVCLFNRVEDDDGAEEVREEDDIDKR